MPRRNETETLELSPDAKIKILVETPKAIKIESILFEIIEEDWLPKSQISFLEINNEIFKAEDLNNLSILNLVDQEIVSITYKKWLSLRKVALSRLAEHFDNTLSTFEKNMREATQFWEGGRFSYCQICGRTLTHEVSIEHGVGPICADHIMQTYERTQAQEIMNAYRMIYEGQFEGLDPLKPIWVAYKFRRRGRKTNIIIKDGKTTVNELAMMYQHSARGKVSHLRWELIRENNNREPTWITIQREARENRNEVINNKELNHNA